MKEYREFTDSILKSGHMKAGDALQPTVDRDHACASATARR